MQLTMEHSKGAVYIAPNRETLDTSDVLELGLTPLGGVFGTNVPLSSTVDLGPLGHGQVTDNIYFPLGGLPYGLVQPGRYGGGPLGTGSTLHVVNFYVGPEATTGQLSDISQVHLDQGNPWILPFGWIPHLLYVLTHSAGACP